MDRAPNCDVFKTRKTNNNLERGEEKKLHSPAGNQTWVFCMTGEDTHYYTTYTTEDCLLGLSCNYKNMYTVKHNSYLHV